MTRRHRMRPVRQQDDKGCGLAVVAMVSRRGYRAVRALALQHRAWRATYGMDAKMLRRMLRLLGRPVLRTTRTERLQGVAIVNVHGLHSRFRHWVVSNYGDIIDPATGDHWPSLSRYLLFAQARSGLWYWIESEPSDA